MTLEEKLSDIISDNGLYESTLMLFSGACERIASLLRRLFTFWCHYIFMVFSLHGYESKLLQLANKYDYY